MRTIFDEVNYNAAGNSVTLIKRACTKDELLDDEDETRPAPEG